MAAPFIRCSQVARCAHSAGESVQPVCTIRARPVEDPRFARVQRLLPEWPCACYLPDARRLPMRQIKVLVVDDDVNLVQALVDLLQQNGYVAVSATSAEDALERCREETFHLVLTDLQLPARNGIALIKL